MNAGFDPEGVDCTVYRGRQTARAIVLSLASAGARSVTVVNRTVARAEVAASLAGAAGRVGTLDQVADAALVVNATSIGLGAVDETVVADMVAPVGKGQLVVDLVYRPYPTPFLLASADRGAAIRGGLGMLVHGRDPGRAPHRRAGADRRDVGVGRGKDSLGGGLNPSGIVNRPIGRPGGEAPLSSTVPGARLRPPKAITPVSSLQSFDASGNPCTRMHPENFKSSTGVA